MPLESNYSKSPDKDKFDNNEFHAVENTHIPESFEGLHNYHIYDH